LLRYGVEVVVLRGQPITSTGYANQNMLCFQ
jgi:hypothetical protein